MDCALTTDRRGYTGDIHREDVWQTLTDENLQTDVRLELGTPADRLKPGGWA